MVAYIETHPFIKLKLKVRSSSSREIHMEKNQVLQAIYRCWCSYHIPAIIRWVSKERIRYEISIDKIGFVVFGRDIDLVTSITPNTYDAYVTAEMLSQILWIFLKLNGPNVKNAFFSVWSEERTVETEWNNTECDDSSWRIFTINCFVRVFVCRYAS